MPSYFEVLMHWFWACCSRSPPDPVLVLTPDPLSRTQNGWAEKTVRIIVRHRCIPVCRADRVSLTGRETSVPKIRMDPTRSLCSAFIYVFSYVREVYLCRFSIFVGLMSFFASSWN